MQIMGSPGILITELKKIRSCAKCIGKTTLITEYEISKIFKKQEEFPSHAKTKSKRINKYCSCYYVSRFL